MSNPVIAPYGFWRSPITSDRIVAETIRFSGLEVDGDEIYWGETRPREGGRSVIVRRGGDGAVSDLLPEPFNARTRVHEYGGGAFCAANGVVYFANWSDQRLYRVAPGEAPRAITAEAAFRYADGHVDRPRQRLICVREDHTESAREALNTLVGIDLAGGGQEVLVSGSDFYSSPRLSPDGSRLAWLAWDHPRMPWDGSELWVGELAADGSVGARARVAGGPGESVFQPEWSPSGELHFVSDRTGWWNLYRERGGQVEALHPLEAEFGVPQWVFRMSTYGFAGPDRIVCAYTAGGRWYVAVLDTDTGAFDTLDLPYTAISSICGVPGGAVFIAGAPAEPPAVVRLDAATGAIQVLKQATVLDETLREFVSIPEAIEFPTEDGLTAHGIFYPPHNPDYLAPPDELPPLLVECHGGPTGQTSSSLSLNIQYWTSRGVAVLDVNYGGSTGYGRAYRERLNDRWGIVDVDDCVNGARFLAETGRVDGGRMAITGGSAGGYTTLCALTFRDVFQAGASHFGVSDLGALARDTHKFESRYLDGLIGPYPERKDLYDERSPINFADRLSAPVAFFQGADDRVVPVDQTERMVEALRARGVPVAYFLFEGEQHGFRRGDNIKRALDGELYFYALLLFRTGLRF